MPIDPYPYPADTQQSDIMVDDIEEEAEEEPYQEQEEEDFQMEVPQPTDMRDDGYPESFSPNIDAFAYTPLTSKKDRPFSSSYTDEDEDDNNDLSFATAATTARGPWSSMKKGSAHSDVQGDCSGPGPWPDRHSLPVPTTPITPLRTDARPTCG